MFHKNYIETAIRTPRMKGQYSLRDSAINFPMAFLPRTRTCVRVRLRNGPRPTPPFGSVFVHVFGVMFVKRLIIVVHEIVTTTAHSKPSKSTFGVAPTYTLESLRKFFLPGYKQLLYAGKELGPTDMPRTLGTPNIGVELNKGICQMGKCAKRYKESPR
ncbi:hypothetical protein B0H14DRAFT_2556714 [Mycena olivaceomarginata]|nr:hypothetical protein B0H14DRAFT_2556714 [Mycena olivaceomarginata]